MRARRAHAAPADLPHIKRDPELLAPFLEDAAHFPGGHAAGLALPGNESGVAAVLLAAASVLPIGAQSSLTGGATPMGDMLLGTSRLNRILDIGNDWVRVQAGVTLAELEQSLSNAGKYYPPVPTFAGACIGGTAATNAAGAGTFKYGTTRDWVQALTVVLANGDVLDIERGETFASPEGVFEITLSDRTVRVPTPSYRMPDVPKRSAGYFAAPEMDLIDLFIGCEGTLGVITQLTLRVMANRPARCLAFVPLADRLLALELVAKLRTAALETWRTRDTRGLDISAIEHVDRRCLDLLREDGVDRLQGVNLPRDVEMAILVTLELQGDVRPERVFDQIGRARDPDAPDTPLVRFCRLLDESAALDSVEIAIPGDESRASQLLAVREAVPAAVNARIGRAKLAVDPRIEKTAADMIVPFARLGELLTIYDDEFRRRELDAAIWGHISDGNLHPNVIPRTWADVESGKQAILTLGRRVIALGGSPLAEHGVGRNPIKQQFVADLYGQTGIDEMRAIKRALDPEWKLAPGVLFPRD
jgi:D-lactate dehydrogenase (cytochrome)